MIFSIERNWIANSFWYSENTAKSKAEKLNNRRGLPGSQQNADEGHIWYIEKPLSGFWKKQKDLRPK